MTEHQDVLKVLEEREKRLYEGLAASSAEMLDDIMSEDIVYIHSQGIADTKQENLIGQQTGLFKHGPVVRRNGGTKVYGNMAVTLGMIDMVDLAHGPAHTLHLEQTLIWINEEGTWRLLLRQATRAKV
jgi:hypothetical protein